MSLNGREFWQLAGVIGRRSLAADDWNGHGHGRGRHGAGGWSNGRLGRLQVYAFNVAAIADTLLEATGISMVGDGGDRRQDIKRVAAKAPGGGRGQTVVQKFESWIDRFPSSP